MKKIDWSSYTTNGLTVNDIINNIVPGVVDTAKRNRFVASRQEMVLSEQNYLSNCFIKNYVGVHNLMSPTTLATIGDMKWLYSSRFVQLVGRRYYDYIMSKSRNEKCFYCGVSSAYTLDHYYPQSLYPLLTVVPTNLVPCCGFCQNIKGSFVSSKRDEFFLNPYFDDIENINWLEAILISTAPILLVYKIKANALPSVLESRLNWHLNKLQVLRSMSILGASYLNSISYHRTVYINNSDQLGLIKNYSEMAYSMLLDDMNSISALALLAALSNKNYLQ